MFDEVAQEIHEHIGAYKAGKLEACPATREAVEELDPDGCPLCNAPASEHKAEAS